MLPPCAAKNGYQSRKTIGCVPSAERLWQALRQWRQQHARAGGSARLCGLRRKKPCRDIVGTRPQKFGRFTSNLRHLGGGEINKFGFGDTRRLQKRPKPLGFHRQRTSYPQLERARTGPKTGLGNLARAAWASADQVTLGTGVLNESMDDLLTNTPCGTHRPLRSGI